MNNDKFQELKKDIVTANNAAQWLNESAWEDILGHEMRAHREILVNQLIAVVLGKTGLERTAEQLAGEIQGIDTFYTVVDKVFRRGLKARDALKKVGFNSE